MEICLVLGAGGKLKINQDIQSLVDGKIEGIQQCFENLSLFTRRRMIEQVSSLSYSYSESVTAKMKKKKKDILTDLQYTAK